ncbi:Vacuolar protein sorting-associated protein 16, partial [Halocaridina rubra]
VLQPSQKTDEQIAKEINGKLGYTPGISYTDIANRADRAGRKQLAVKLIEYECRAKEQVLVLMRLGESPTALRRALQSGDTDLIYTVLDHLRQQLPSGDFLMLIRDFPVAQSLYIRSCRELDTDQLRDILVQEDDFQGQALLRIKEAYHSNRADTRQASLQGASELFRKAKYETAFQMTEEQVKLIKWQVKLEDSQQKPYANMSLHDTLHQLMKDGQIKDAEKLRLEFKIPERRYWWARVLAHAEACHWDDLAEFSKNKKNPIGFE